MPTFNLGRLGRFQITRLPPADTPLPTEHQDLPSCPPPEYTDIDEDESSTKYHAPSQAQPPECKTEQLRRFLIEIVAMTFNANFDKLNAALYDIPVPTDTNTILCDSERAYLLAQSDLVRKVHGYFLSNGKTKIDRKDEEELCETIVRPAKAIYEFLDTLPHFSLDMIGWYGEQVRRPCDTRWAATIPGYWATDPFQNSKGPQEQLKDCMRSFCVVIERVTSNDQVHDVLWKVWDDSRRRCGLHELGKQHICWPMREKYTRMGDSLMEMPLLGPWVDVSES